MAVDWLVPSIMGAQAILLALIGRLRFRCVPDPQTGDCVVSSGCSEVPLQDSHDQVDAHEYTVGGQRILLVTPKT